MRAGAPSAGQSCLLRRVTPLVTTRHARGPVAARCPLPLLDKAAIRLCVRDALNPAAIAAATYGSRAYVLRDDIGKGVVCRRIAGPLGLLVPQGAARPRLLRRCAHEPRMGGAPVLQTHSERSEAQVADANAAAAPKLPPVHDVRGAGLAEHVTAKAAMMASADEGERLGTLVTDLRAPSAVPARDGGIVSIESVAGSPCRRCRASTA